MFRALRPYEPYTARQPVSTTTLTNPPSITVLRFQERVSFPVGSETPKLNKTGNVRINVSLRRVHINLLAPELFFLNLAHPVYKM